MCRMEGLSKRRDAARAGDAGFASSRPRRGRARRARVDRPQSVSLRAAGSSSRSDSAGARAGQTPPGGVCRQSARPSGAAHAQVRDGIGTLRVQPSLRGADVLGRHLLAPPCQDLYPVDCGLPGQYRRQGAIQAGDEPLHRLRHSSCGSRQAARPVRAGPVAETRARRGRLGDSASPRTTRRPYRIPAHLARRGGHDPGGRGALPCPLSLGAQVRHHRGLSIRVYPSDVRLPCLPRSPLRAALPPSGEGHPGQAAALRERALARHPPAAGRGRPFTGATACA